MSCSKVRRLLSKYIDKEIKDQPTIDLIDAHLSQCPGCQQELDSLAAIKGLLWQKEHSPARPDFLRRLRQRLEPKAPAAGIDWLAQFGELARRLIPVPAVVAALVIIMLAINFNNLNYVNEYLFRDLTPEDITMLSEEYDVNTWY